MADVRKRLEAAIHSKVWDCLAAESERSDRSMAEIVNEKLALSYGLDPVRYALPRKRVGRKPARSARSG